MMLFLEKLDSVLEQLKDLGLERSPYVVISVIGQELLAMGKLSESIEILECAVKLGTTSLKLKQSVCSALSSAYWSLKNISKALHYMQQDLAVAKSLGKCAIHAVKCRNIFLMSNNFQEITRVSNVLMAILEWLMRLSIKIPSHSIIIGTSY